jgi:ribosomal protein S8E
LNKDGIQAAIREAKDHVSDQEEPWKSLAFQVILSRLISEQESDFGNSHAKIHSKRIVEATSSRKMALERSVPSLSIPEQSLEKILTLKEREQIPILWSFSSKQSMTVDEFLAASSTAGVSISPSYSPTKGGNFRNRLVKQDKMFVEDGKLGKVSKYKLSAAGKLKAQKFF